MVPEAAGPSSVGAAAPRLWNMKRHLTTGKIVYNINIVLYSVKSMPSRAWSIECDDVV